MYQLNNSRSCSETRFDVICAPEGDFCMELMTRNLMLPKFGIFLWELGGSQSCRRRLVSKAKVSQSRTCYEYSIN